MNKTALRILRSLPAADIENYDADTVVFACSRAANLVEKADFFTVADAAENVTRWLRENT